MSDASPEIPQLSSIGLRLAGSPHVLRTDGSVLPLGPRDAVMLAWLALEGPTPRMRLAALLWPESPAEAARNTLRQRLFQLRKLFGETLVAGQGSLALARGVRHDLDEADTVLDGAELDMRGELMVWLAQQREQRLARKRQALVQRADRAEAERDHAHALEYARELLALDPLSEQAHRRLMRLHYLAGDRAAALLAFDACERTLKDEVSAAPSEETLALLRTITAAERSGRVAPHVLPAALMQPPRMIGRATELNLVVAAWQGGQVAWVEGEAGMGKSRLLHEALGARAGILASAARPGDTAVPYSTLARALRLLCQRVPQVLAERPRLELARLLPEVGVVDAAPSAASPAAQRMTLQRGLCELLRNARTAGLEGIVVDDLHFADAASLEMLVALSQSDAVPGLRWAFAVRPADGAAGVRTLHETLLEEQRLQPVRLEPLDAPRMAELLGSLGLDGVDSAALAAMLHRHSGGNPLFALETLRQAWAEDRLGSNPGSRLPKPAGVTQLIARRLAQLSASAVRLARCAALAWPDFSIEMATEVLGVSALDLADTWSELEQAQVLNGGAFAHDLIYEAALASVPTPIAQHLHGQIARYLSAHGGEPARLAQHWAQARQWEQAAAAFAAAAERARHGARISECVALLDRAAQCWAQAGNEEARYGILLQRSEVLAAFEFGDLALASQQELEALASSPLQRLQALQQRLALHEHRYENSMLVALAPEARQAAHALGRIDVEISVAIRWAHALCDARRAADAVALLEPYAQGLGEHADDDLRFEFWMALALARDYSGRLREALGTWDIVMDLPGVGRRQDQGWQIRIDRAATLSKMGRVVEAASIGEQQLLVMRSACDIPRVKIARSEAIVAHRLRDIGRYRDALALLEQVQQTWDEASSLPIERAWVEHRLAVMYQQLGQPERAAPLLKTDHQGLHVGLSMMRLVHRADLDHQMGRNGLPRLREALNMIADANDIYHRIATLFATWLVPPDEGEALAASLAVWASSQERFGVALSGHVRAAACGLAQGAAARALPHAEAALRLARDYQPDTFYLPEMWLVAARIYDALGRQADAGKAALDGQRWVMTVHDAHVPAPFRRSFLQRNTVNRDLLALAARLAV